MTAATAMTIMAMTTAATAMYDSAANTVPGGVGAIEGEAVEVEAGVAVGATVGVGVAVGAAAGVVLAPTAIPVSSDEA